MGRELVREVPGLFKDTPEFKFIPLESKMVVVKFDTLIEGGSLKYKEWLYPAPFATC